jgi:transcriptional regulator with XRE-family HTH domain
MIMSSKNNANLTKGVIMNNNFGEFLYTLRKERGWTQTELADKLGITNKAVSKWETGDAFPETAQLVPLATIFNISVDELLRGEKNPGLEREKPPVIEEPKELKPMTKNQAIAIAAAIGLILVGVMTLITLAVNDVGYGIYVPVLLASVAVAVFMLVVTGMRRSLDSAEMDEAAYKKGVKISVAMALGIALTVLSVIPIIALNAVDVGANVYIPIFFSVLIIGVPIIIFSGIQWGNLVKAYDIPSDEGAPLKGKAKNLEEVFSGVIMMSATVIFLLLGFLKGLWHPAWVVFPIGGILCGIVSTLIRGFYNNNKT